MNEHRIVISSYEQNGSYGAKAICICGWETFDGGVGPFANRTSFTSEVRLRGKDHLGESLMIELEPEILNGATLD